MKSDKLNIPDAFNNNVSGIIKTQIESLNEHSSVLYTVIENKCNVKRKVVNYKLTEEELIDEINHLIGEECMDIRTLRNIKKGNMFNKTFNVMVIIYVLNYITNKVNVCYGKTVVNPIVLNDILNVFEKIEK